MYDIAKVEIDKHLESLRKSAKMYESLIEYAKNC